MRPLLMLIALGGLVSAARADDLRTQDKEVADVLREIHDRGAELYNSGDTPGGYRMYQGGLIVARAALRHRPEVQKLITDGMVAAEKQASIARRTFMLHELIEQVRTELRISPKAGEPLAVPPREVKPAPKPAPGPELRPDPKAEPKLEPKPEPKPELRPQPKVEPKPDPKPEPKPEPKPAAGVGEVKDGVVGRVLWQNKPVAGVEVTFVTLGRPQPKVYETATGPQGVYAVPALPPGKYVVLITPGRNAEVKKLPERYATATTSPLVIEVKAAGEKVDFVLQ